MEKEPLKILIVEDNPKKKQKMFERLRGLPEVFCEPDVVVSASEAVRRLQDTAYDLLILDVLIPYRPDGDESEQHSIDLLARIDAGLNGIHRPRHVLLVSSQESLSDTAKEFFRRRPWGCIHYAEESAQCLDDIEHIGRWIQLDLGRSAKKSECDIFVITALEEPEFTAIEFAINQVGSLGPLVPLDSTQLVRYCDVTSNGRIIKIGIGFAPRMGPVATAVLCTKVIELLRPRMVLMAGICGAIADKAGIGDLVAADASWDWQSGKYINNGGSDFLIAPHQLGISTQLRNILIRLKREKDFWDGFGKDAIQLKTDIPKMVVGPMATGASVVADERVTAKIKEEQHKNVVGIDMETYAVYAAAASGSCKVGALSLKAVSDRADIQKNDLYQPYAAKVSATTVVKLIVEYGTELVDLYAG